MKKIAFKNKRSKWILVFILLLLIAYNIHTLIDGDPYAYIRIPFQIVLLIMIFLKNSYAKGFLEIASFLYAVMIGLNIILIVIPLLFTLIAPIENNITNISISLIVALVKLILAIVVYKLSRDNIFIVTKKSN